MLQAKEVVVVKKITAIKNKANPLQMDKKKDAWEDISEISKIPPIKVQRWESAKISFEKRVPGTCF